jgi:hypothetical protein
MAIDAEITNRCERQRTATKRMQNVARECAATANTMTKSAHAMRLHAALASRRATGEVR